MKRTVIYVISFVLAVFLGTSCDDYLEKPPGVDLTEDMIFDNEQNLEEFINGTYWLGVTSDLGWQGREGGGGYAPCCDEGEISMAWYFQHVWNRGALNASTGPTTHDTRWDDRWKALRRANILIERIENITFEPTSREYDYKKRVMGEALWIRAYNHFELFRKFGGIPKIDRRLNMGDDMKIPRSSVEEIVRFIVKDCEDAAGLLPSSYASNERGRIHKGAALALKARTLLYAASPQFNTGTPYMSLGSNNNLICYGNTEIERWKAAADAALAVLTWAETEGKWCKLIDTGQPDKDYLTSWNVYDNSEIILAQKASGAVGPWHWPFEPMIPKTQGQGGISVPLNFVMLYQKKDGTDQSWDLKNGGDDLLAKYSELDPRFAQTHAYHTSKWNNQIEKLDMTSGSVNNPLEQPCWGGVMAHKPVPYDLSSDHPIIPNVTLFRLAEFYLNYAEALNEADPGMVVPEPARLKANVIRVRAGMPVFPAGMSKTDFRKAIKRERAIELAYENHRLWDLRRWLDCEQDGVMKGDMYGIKIYPLENNPADFKYVPYVFEKRFFPKYMYLNPFPQSEVNKGYIVQNPGY